MNQGSEEYLTLIRTAGEDPAEEESEEDGPVASARERLSALFRGNGRHASTASALAEGDLTDQEWERIAPLLPHSKGRRGRDFRDHRQVINGILWIQRTGGTWENLPRRYGPKSTCHDRLRRWQREGVWERILQVLGRDL
jgi:hypothetical protein